LDAGTCVENFVRTKIVRPEGGIYDYFQISWKVNSIKN